MLPTTARVAGDAKNISHTFMKINYKFMVILLL